MSNLLILVFLKRNTDIIQCLTSADYQGGNLTNCCLIFIQEPSLFVNFSDGSDEEFENSQGMRGPRLPHRRTLTHSITM